jgi:fructokinase
MTQPPEARVVALGEALVDLIGRPDPDGATRYTALPGGSPMNAAVAAARLGTPTAILTRFSRDAFGALLRAHLQRSGVDLGLAEEGDEPTSLAVATIDARGQASYAFYRAETADAAYDPQPRPTLPTSVRAGNVTISLLREPARSAFFDVVAASGRAGSGQVAWVLDPNARSALWRDARTFAAEVERWAEIVDVVKVSDEDLAFLEVSETEATTRWFAAGIRAVAVTAGGAGARLHRPGAAPLALPGRRVAVIDTVGAGDTFTAALTTSLADGFPAHDAAWRALLERAVCASSLTCSRAGADPPTAAELTAALGG